MTDLVIIERPAAGVALVTLNRPEARNAFNSELLEAFSEALSNLDHDGKINAVVVTGGLQTFGAGGDLGEMAQATPVELWASPRHDYWAIIHQFKKPLIAAVNGPAFGGGCELALASDIVIAGQSARFALPEIKLGFVPGRGGTQRLPRIVGKSQAMFMILTGSSIDARKAVEVGIALEAVEIDQTIPRAIEVASLIASKPRVAVQIAKELVADASGPLLQDGISKERHCYEFLISTDDAKEGMGAFLEKRDPTFKGT